MKKLLIFIYLGFACSLADAQHVRYDTIRYARKYYATRVALFRSEPVVKGRIIFLGNSITEFGDWRKLLHDTAAINRGIAADNSFGVLDRLDDVILRQPSKLFIKIGINDISQNIPVDLIVKNITTIVKQVKEGSPETKIYVHSILPTNDNVKNEYPDAFNKNDQIDIVNKQIKQNSKNDNFTYVDLNKELRDRDGKLDVKYAESDGLHLNTLGYQVWIKLLKSKKYL